MNDFDTYIAQVGEAASRRRPMSAHEWRSLALGLGIPLAFLLLLVGFLPH